MKIFCISDANWWKGEGANGIGLFPSNFVAPFVEEEKQENTTQNLKDSSNENVATNHPAEPVVVNEVYGYAFDLCVFLVVSKVVLYGMIVI